MRTTIPTPEELADHKGNPRPRVPMPMSYEQARLGMAFHEAGHAVLALSYGMRVQTSEVIAWIDEAGWHVTGRTSTEVQFPLHPWRFAAQSAAGTLAQVQYLMAYGLWTPERAAACAAVHDREQAIDVLTQFGHHLALDHAPEGGKSWGMVRGMARRKIGHLWSEIRTVAHAMDARTVLSGDEIADLTGLVNPTLSGGAA
jgi:hypothetical protein